MEGHSAHRRDGRPGELERNHRHAGQRMLASGPSENRLFYDSPTFFNDMRRLHDRGRQLNNAHDAAEEAEKKYQDSLQSKAQTSPCGAICTSHGHEGRLCSRQLTARRLCSSRAEAAIGRFGCRMTQGGSAATVTLNVLRPVVATVLTPWTANLQNNLPRRICTAHWRHQ